MKYEISKMCLTAILTSLVFCLIIVYFFAGSHSSRSREPTSFQLHHVSLFLQNKTRIDNSSKGISKWRLSKCKAHRKWSGKLRIWITAPRLNELNIQVLDSQLLDYFISTLMLALESQCITVVIRGVLISKTRPPR